jgi:hypothetical protein
MLQKLNKNQKLFSGFHGNKIKDDLSDGDSYPAAIAVNWRGK